MENKRNRPFDEKTPEHAQSRCGRCDPIGNRRGEGVLNCRTRDILTQNGAGLTFLPSDDVSVWPEYLRRKMELGEVAMEDEEREM